MKYLLMLVLMAGCAPAHVTYPSDVAAYYEDFARIIGPDRVTSGTIQFETDGYFQGNVIGLCVKPAIGDWSIHLKRSMWAISSDSYRKAVLFHELTHCILDHLEHSSDPRSYMYYLQTTPADIDQQVLHWL